MRNWLVRVLQWFRRRQTGYRFYTGATSSRLTADWVFAQLQTPANELRSTLRVLRARARDLARNNPYGRRFVALVAENIIGPHGIRLQARVTRPDGSLDVEINDRIERAWKEWGQPQNASVDGRLSWTQIQQLVAKTVATDGEAFVRCVPGFPNPFGFALQILDADQIDEYLTQSAQGGRNAIEMGIEVDRWGRAVAYHVNDVRPGEFGVQRRRVRIPAEEIVHVYLMDRPGQPRGVTWFAPVLLPLKMLGGYEEAHVIATRIAASKVGFFVTSPEAETSPDADSFDVPREMTVAPGTFEQLPPGVQLQQWDPDFPDTGFGDFVRAQLRSIAAGFGVSYPTLSGDLAEVNYSSIRAGLITERDTWRMLQVAFIELFHERIYRQWLRFALTTGALDLPSRNAERWMAHVWQPRGWQSVDPQKEVDAWERSIALGVLSRSRLAAEQGFDLEETLKDLAREQQLASELGVPLPAPESPVFSASPGPASNRIAEVLRNGRH